MNKITATAAGLAIVAAASIAPAFAQGSFTTAGPFVFAFSPTNSFTVTNLPVAYNPFGGGAASAGFLTLSGGSGMGMGPVFSNTNLSFSPTLGGAATVTDVVPFSFVVPVPGNGYGISSFGPTANQNSFNLRGGNPVPEASTVLSFGALLALGGFAVLRRKSAVQSAA